MQKTNTLCGLGWIAGLGYERMKMERAPENHEQQMKDSDMIFTAISSGDFDDFKQAEQAVVMLYVMDMSFSRAGISHALTRLERFYAERPNVQIEGLRAFAQSLSNAGLGCVHDLDSLGLQALLAK